MRHLPLPSLRPPASPNAPLLPRLLLLAALLPALAAPPVAAQGFGYGTLELVNSNAVGDSHNDYDPCIATNGAGTWITVWISDDDLGGTVGTDRDVFVARSSDNGNSWSTVAVVDPDTNEDPDYAPQVLATDGASRWLAVWHSDYGIHGNMDILFSTSADNGVSWTGRTPLHSNAESDSGSDQFPHAAVDGAGNVVVVWFSDENLGGTIGTDDDIFFASSPDGGISWSGVSALNSNAATDGGGDRYPQVATDGGGNWVAVWQSTDDLGGTIGTDWDILVARSSDYGGTWSAPAALNSNASSDSDSDRKPSVATDGSGNWVAVWHTEELLVARSTDNGATWTPPASLNLDAAANSHSEFRARVTTDRAGNWVTIWWALDWVGVASDRDIVYSRSTDNGAEWTSTEPLNVGIGPYEDSGPSLATDGAGNWVAVWHSNSDAHYSDTDFDILAEMTNQIPVELSGFALD